jgi:hypothetical protein
VQLRILAYLFHCGCCGMAGETDTVWVGNLEYSVSDQEIKDHFSQCGDVDDVRLPTDSQTGRNKGFCFVRFKANEAATLAKQELDGTELGSRLIKVELALSKAKPPERERSHRRGDRRSRSASPRARDDRHHDIGSTRRSGRSRSRDKQERVKKRSRSRSRDKHERTNKRSRSRSRDKKDRSRERNRREGSSSPLRDFAGREVRALADRTETQRSRAADDRYDHSTVRFRHACLLQPSWGFGRVLAWSHSVKYVDRRSPAAVGARGGARQSSSVKERVKSTSSSSSIAASSDDESSSSSSSSPST